MRPDRAPQPRPGLADHAYFAAFEAARAQVLRQRIVWTLNIVMVLLAIALLGLYFEYREFLNNQQPPLTVLFLGVAEDVAIFCTTLATMLYVLAAKPDRTRLVRAITLATLAIMGTATFFEIRRSIIHPTDFLGDPVAWGDPSYWASRSALLAHAILVTLPFVVIPMRLAESARIALGCWALYVALVLGFAQPTILNFLKFSLYAALVPVPAALFSWWRYSLFDASFERRELRGRYRELSSELLQARKLHEALLPKPLADGPAHIGYAYEPMRQIGGDLVYTTRMADHAAGHESIYVVLVDVSGHGVPAALAVNRLHGELERIFASANASRSGQPAHPLSAGDVISALNAYVYLTLSQQGVFATGICLRIEAEQVKPGVMSPRSVQWSNAGHPPALVKSNTDERSAHPLGSTAIMLGVLAPDEFEDAPVRLDVLPGDVIVAYTDGLPETRGPGGEEFGIDRIVELVRTHTPQHTSVIREALADAKPRDSTPWSDPSAQIPIAKALMHAASKHRHGPVTDDTLIVEIALTAWPVAQAPHQSPVRSPDTHTHSPR